MADENAEQPASLAALKEGVRQLEARIAVQTQEKIATEARIVSLLSWLTALLVPITTLFLYISASKYAEFIPFRWASVALLWGFFAAWMWNLGMSFMFVGWRYVGTNRWDTSLSEQEVLQKAISRYEESIRLNRSIHWRVYFSGFVPAIFCIVSITVAALIVGYPKAFMSLYNWFYSVQ